MLETERWIYWQSLFKIIPMYHIRGYDKITEMFFKYIYVSFSKRSMNKYLMVWQMYSQASLTSIDYILYRILRCLRIANKNQSNKLLIKIPYHKCALRVYVQTAILYYEQKEKDKVKHNFHQSRYTVLKKSYRYFFWIHIVSILVGIWTFFFSAMYS